MLELSPFVLKGATQYGGVLNSLFIPRLGKVGIRVTYLRTESLRLVLLD